MKKFVPTIIPSILLKLSKPKFWVWFLTAVIVFFTILLGVIWLIRPDENSDAELLNSKLLVNFEEWCASPGGSYEAILRNIEHPDAHAYVIIIRDMESYEEYRVNMIFFKRFTNFIAWADDDDTLWAYNSDIGIYYWKHVNGSWIEYSADNGIHKYPEILIKLRPERFSS